MELPIYIEGKKEGVLTMEKRDAVTIVRARLRDVGGVVRLWVFGEREAYLGVPEPEEGELVLTRRLSPGDMRRFPQKPEYAAEKRLPEGKAQKGEQRPALGGRHVLWQGGKPYFF